MTRRALYLALAVGALSTATLAWYQHARGERGSLRERLLDAVSQRSVIFFGDSHIACAIDDDVDPRIANLGSANEFYWFTALKVRRTRPRVAVIGVWVHDFLPYFANPLPRVAFSHYDLWVQDLSTEGRTELLKQMPFEDRAYFFARSWIPFLGTQLSTDIPGSRQGLGGFMGYPSRPVVMAAAAVHRLEQMAEPASHEPLTFQTVGLDRLLAECDAAGARVVLLSTPVHGSLRRRLPDWMTRNYEAILADLGRRHPFRRWDESARPMGTDAFYDADHLTSDGALAFTRGLIPKLEAEGLAE